MGPLSIISLIALLVVLGILFAGLFAMGRRGQDAGRLSNKLMRMRIIAQFVAVALILTLALLGGR